MSRWFSAWRWGAEQAPGRACSGGFPLSMQMKDESESSRLPLAMLAGVGVVLLVLGGFYLLLRGGPSTGAVAEQPLPFEDAERAYAQQIHFSKPQMSRAANTLNQEVTFIVGTLENSGARTVRQIEVSIEFHDLINQVVLRDTHRLLANGARVGPGQKQEFQINFDRVPNDWNRQYPAFKVIGLQLE